MMLETNSLYLKLLEKGSLRLEPAASVRVSAIDLSDEDRLEEFDRELAVEIGGRAVLSWRDFQTYGRYMKDVSDAHDGEEVALGVQWNRDFGKSNVTIGGGTRYQSKELMTWMYGITDKDTASGFQTTSLDSGWSEFAEIKLTYPLTQKLGLLVSASGERLPESVLNSPIVDERNTWKVGTGLTWTF